MSTATPFDVLAHPLGGAHLVEASAGTGKTYNITTLVVRLLLETGLRIDQILVVTFTKAATAELTGRVRARLAQALAAFRAGASSDPTLAALVVKHARADAEPRLAAAVRDFDQAAIYTIHSFCQRALVSFAFESGEPFAFTFLESAGDLYRELGLDFWAKTAYPAERAWLDAMEDVYGGPGALDDLAKKAAERPDLDLLPVTGRAPLECSPEALRVRFDAAAALWRSDRAAIVALVDCGAGVLKVAYKPECVAPVIVAFEALFSASMPAVPHMPAGSHLFLPETLAAATKVKKVTPSHPFFTAWAAWAAAARAWRVHTTIELQRTFHTHAGETLERWKQARNERTYGDLLVRLSRALAGPRGAGLADAMFARFPAALIDEFQDTDPVQFSVFRRVYAAGRGSLFLIGDPKQAIFAFRGGDIYAYLGAVKDTRHATLDTNFRSDPTLVAAVATLYSGGPNPFLEDRIPFLPVKAAHGVRIAGPTAAPAPLQLRMLRQAGKGKQDAITSGWATHHLPALVAGDIVAFLASDARIERKDPVTGALSWTGPRPSDVAVLVRKNVDAMRMQAALRHLGVHSVVSTEDSVFQSAESGELWTVLQAVLSPASDRHLRAAAATSLLAVGASELGRLVEDDAAWAAWAGRFQEWRDTWQARGFAPLLRELLAAEISVGAGTVQGRLVAAPGGERAMTNLLHVGELLQREEQRASLGPVGVMRFFENRRAGRGESAGDEELRLESDGNAATILTVFKAKGLQFAAVWLPYGHIAFGADKVRPLYHPAPDERATVDLEPGKWEDPATGAEVEAAAQERRILYVALTRAVHRLTVYWGVWWDGDRSALAALLHPPAGPAAAAPGALIRDTVARLENLDEDARMAELEALAVSSGGTIAASWVDEGPASDWADDHAPSEPMRLATFTGRVRTGWRRTSYSGLIRGHAIAMPSAAADHDDELDEIEGGPAMPDPADNAADAAPCLFTAFPRGKNAGTALHAIFEHADFTRSGAELHDLVAEHLAHARYDVSALTAPTAAALRSVLATPLGGGLGDFSLGQLPRARRLDELAFTFPISASGPTAPSVTKSALCALLAAHGRPDLALRVGSLEFARLRGHLGGFVDLVFEAHGRYWIVDYKSNFLGERLGHYTRARMEEEMRRHLYDLQYLVYAVALHRYLRLRVPGYTFAEHFGGVRYLFVRGMTPATGAARGVHADTPTEALVTGLDALLRAGAAPRGGGAA
ncbi:MAG: exodeoxyribonuclease V subunit beta [Myxococcota bacterium]